jgi:biotin-[acetyl-CoA-carboxylase] ligase BirA-like protein
MRVLTNDAGFAERLVGPGAWTSVDSIADPGLEHLAARTFDGQAVLERTIPGRSTWRHLLTTATSDHSQYDLLIELGRRPQPLPDGVLMLAGAGQRFHGFRGRAWTALPGNLHLSAHLVPDRPVEHLGTAFTVLAAVSVVDAIDRVPGLEGRAGIKWVNDVLIDGAKVAGVLGYTHLVGRRVAGVVLGIGMNVETDPVFEPTPYVPTASSLRSALGGSKTCTQGAVFPLLIDALARNYRLLLDGDYGALLDRYRSRSLAIGREVLVCAEDSGDEPDIIGSGRVLKLGDDLELHLESSVRPITKGRLILGGSCHRRSC